MSKAYHFEVIKIVRKDVWVGADSLEEAFSDVYKEFDKSKYDSHVEYLGCFDEEV